MCVCVCVCRQKGIELYILRFAVFVTVECVEVIPSYCLCQCSLYRDIIVLQSHIAVHSQHFVWWHAAHIACAPIPVFCLVCCVAVNGRIWLTICQEGAGNGLPMCLTCVLLACWNSPGAILDAVFWTLSDHFQFDHYYCALDALVCLAGTNGVGSTLLNKKVTVPSLICSETFIYKIHRIVINNCHNMYNLPMWIYGLRKQ